MDAEDAAEGASLLEQTPVLDALREAPLSRRGLQERFGVSRTTAYRTTVDLEARGLVERANDEYHLTPYGLAVVGAGDRYADALTAAERLAPLLETMRHPAFVDALHLFADADVVTTDPDDPFGLVQSLMERLTAADRYRCLVRAIGPAPWFAVAADRAAEGVDIEAIFTRDGMTHIDAAAADHLAAALDLPTCRAYVSDDVPFALNTFDDAVVVVSEDDRTGLPNACAITERTDAWDWAEATFRRCRRTADPVDPADLPG